MNKLSHWDYCQFLLVSQTNYTQTYFADHAEELSHDRVNRLLREKRLTPRELRETVRREVNYHRQSRWLGIMHLEGAILLALSNTPSFPKPLVYSFLHHPFLHHELAFIGFSQ